MTRTRLQRAGALHPVSHCLVRWRRLVARRPWIHWLIVTTLAAATAAEVSSQVDAVAAERARWGTTRTVAVASRPADPGEPLAVERRDVPAAVVPDTAIDPSDAATGLVARQHVDTGEIVTGHDVVGGGPLPLVPAGWVAVPVVESPSSGATPGERVHLVSEGVVLVADALVADRHGDVTLIAVPADRAPAVPTAAAAGTLAVLRSP